ncbi:MAG: hypothetical protein WDM96_17590 [Lacunisphaera sp.]
MLSAAKTITQQRSFAISSIVIAILAEELLHSILVILALKDHMMSFAILGIIKYEFAMFLADFEYGRIALSVLGAYFLFELTIPDKPVLLFIYISSAVIPSLGLYFFSAQYAVMFIGKHFWLKPIFFQSLACAITGVVWASYCSRTLRKMRTVPTESDISDS